MLSYITESTTGIVGALLVGAGIIVHMVMFFRRADAPKAMVLMVLEILPFIIGIFAEKPIIMLFSAGIIQGVISFWPIFSTISFQKFFNIVFYSFKDRRGFILVSLFLATAPILIGTVLMYMAMY